MSAFISATVTTDYMGRGVNPTFVEVGDATGGHHLPPPRRHRGSNLGAH